MVNGMAKITDPELLKQLNAEPSSSSKVTDPELLKQLNAPASVAEPSVGRAFTTGLGSALLKSAAGIAGIPTALGATENPAHEKLAQWAAEGEANAPGYAGDLGKLVGTGAQYAAFPAANLLKASALVGGLTAATSEGTIPDRLVEGAKAAATNAALGKVLAAAGTLGTRGLEKLKAAWPEVQANTALRGASQEAGAAHGLVNSPSEANPSLVGSLLESFAGKAATRQGAQQLNADVVTKMMRKELGVNPLESLSPEVFTRTVQSNYAPYQKLAALPEVTPLAKGYSGPSKVFNARDDLEALKMGRDDLRDLYKVQRFNPTTATKHEINQTTAQVKAIEDRFIQRANAAGIPGLVDDLNKARTDIAKTYSVKDATNASTGMVDAREFGKRIDTGKPIGGLMKTAGDFEQSFPNAFRDPEHIPAPDVNALLNYLGQGVGGLAGFLAGGPVGGVAGAMAAPIAQRGLSTATRKYLLSPAGQAKFGKIPKTLEEYNNRLESKAFQAFIKAGKVGKAVPTMSGLLNRD